MGAGSGAPSMPAALSVPFAALRDRLGALRARITARAGFRAWATRFPLTRPIARKNAAALFDLCAGFVYSQVLGACLQLQLFDLLRAGPMSADALATRLGLSIDAASRLLDAAAALDLLARRADGQYALGGLGAALVDNPGIAAMVGHHGLFYDDLRDPVALLRRGHGESLSRYWAYAGSAPGDAAAEGQSGAYSALMGASQPMVAAEVCAAYRFSRHRRVLDVGGGDGSFLRAVAAQAPRTAVTLFDLPDVAARARARFAEAGLGGRAEAVGGDFRSDALPRGADLVTLVRVLHDHDDQVVRDLLRRVYEALPPGGHVLVAEPMAGAKGADHMASAYLGFYLLAMGQGRPRRAEELSAMLREAGFAEPRLVRTALPLVTSVLVAGVPSR